MQEFSISKMKKISTCSQFCNHSKVQLQKRWRTYERNTPNLITELIIPIIFVLSALLFTLASIFTISPSLTLLPVSQYGSTQDIFSS